MGAGQHIYGAALWPPSLKTNGNGDVAEQVGFPRRPKSAALAVVGSTDRPPKWIKPQLTRLVDEAPAGRG
jgi:hypothetical protein